MGLLIRPMPAPPPILCLELQSRWGAGSDRMPLLSQAPQRPQAASGLWTHIRPTPHHSLLGGACPLQRRHSHFSPQQGKCLENNPTSTCPDNTQHMVSDANCHTSRFTSHPGNGQSVAENHGGPLQCPLQANFMLLLFREQLLL